MTRLRKVVAQLCSDRKKLALFLVGAWAVLAAVYITVALLGWFSRDLPAHLPTQYRTSPSSYMTLSRAQFDEILKRGDDVQEVWIYGEVPTIIISREDYMRQVLVDYGENPLASGPDKVSLPDRLKESKNVKVHIDKAVQPDGAERYSPWGWGLGFGLLGLGIALLIWYKRPQWKAEDNAQATTLARRTQGLGLAGASASAGTAGTATDAERPKTTFDDVAGCDEAIEKLRRVRKWLRHSFWFSLFKAKIPRGILLVGPPGTGKTLLARALAGETDASYFFISGSDFVEMYVGVGARRVRDIVDKAKAARKKTGKPSIIFIDEIDAVGKKRSKDGSRGDSERDQTLNQLLVLMDGFEPSSGILFIAATNLAETLDPALLRPGRFDYHVSVDYPDIEGREKIFAIHTRGMQLAPEVSLRRLAIRTPNFSGAHIGLTCSEAGVIAAERLEHLTTGLTEEEMEALPRPVTLEDFDKAIDFVQFGDELLSRMRSQTPEDQENTSVHEAGHAVIATACGGDPVTKITRSIRTKSLGMMQAHSESNRYGMKESELRVRIMTAMGGQAAQLEVLGYRDTGASNDFEQCNRLARFMVGAYGMSPLGPIQIRLDEQGFPVVPLSPMLAGKFDEAWMGIIEECWKETQQKVKENRDKIDRVAKALMIEETILGARFRALYDGTAQPLEETTVAEDDANAQDPPVSIPDATGFSC